MGIVYTPERKIDTYILLFSRRQEIQTLLGSEEYPLSITAYPRYDVKLNFIYVHPLVFKLGGVAKLIERLTEESAVPGSIPSWAHTFLEIDHGIFLTVIFTFPLIQDEQLSVTGEFGHIVLLNDF